MIRHCPSLSGLAASRALLAQLASGHAAAGGSVTLTGLDAPLARLTFSNAGKANALSPAMMIQFADAVTALESARACRGLVVAGTAARFCSGADLGSDGDNLRSPAAGAAMSDVMTDATRRLAALPLISVAALEGGAVGGGAELALAADFRIAAPDAFLHFVQVERGVVPGWGGLARLARLAGRRTALYLIASAARVDARSAASFGLVDAILAPTPELTMQQHAAAFLEPLIRSEAAAGDRAAATAAAVAAAKRALAEEDVAAAEHGAFRALWGSPRQVASVRTWRRL